MRQVIKEVFPFTVGKVSPSRLLDAGGEWLETGEDDHEAQQRLILMPFLPPSRVRNLMVGIWRLGGQIIPGDHFTTVSYENEIGIRIHHGALASSALLPLHESFRETMLPSFGNMKGMHTIRLRRTGALQRLEVGVGDLIYALGRARLCYMVDEYSIYTLGERIPRLEGPWSLRGDLAELRGTPHTPEGPWTRGFVEGPRFKAAIEKLKPPTVGGIVAAI